MRFTGVIVRACRTTGNWESEARRPLLDPLQRTLEILRLDGGHWVIVAIRADQEIVRAEPFEAAAIELSRLWAD